MPAVNMVIPARVEHSIEPLGCDVVESIDGLAPARDDSLHLLRWLR